MRSRPLGVLQQKVLTGRSYTTCRRQGVPAAHAQSWTLALAHLLARPDLPARGRDPAMLALIVAAFRKFMFISATSQACSTCGNIR